LSRLENEVPRVLPLAAVLGRTDDAVVAFIGVASYSTGLSLETVVRLRVRPRGMRHGALHELRRSSLVGRLGARVGCDQAAWVM